MEDQVDQRELNIWHKKIKINRELDTKQKEDKVGWGSNTWLIEVPINQEGLNARQNNKVEEMKSL